MLYAFDLLELDDKDFRGMPLLDELTPNFGDGRDQAAAWACDLTTSISSVNFIPRMTFGNRCDHRDGASFSRRPRQI